MPLYFAYGSNMDRAQMAARCPSSRVRGVARLVRHRFVIMREGYASVVRDPRRTVRGLLWDLALADVCALDRYEGVAGGLYTKVHQSVLTGEGARRALVYVGRESGTGLPRPGYLEAVLAAARAAALPEIYVGELASHGSATSRRSAAGPGTLDHQAGAVTPTRATPLDPERLASPRGWSWTP